MLKLIKTFKERSHVDQFIIGLNNNLTPISFRHYVLSKFFEACLLSFGLSAEATDLTLAFEKTQLFSNHVEAKNVAYYLDPRLIVLFVYRFDLNKNEIAILQTYQSLGMNTNWAFEWFEIEILAKNKTNTPAKPFIIYNNEIIC